MPFFQNVFPSDFKGTLHISNSHHIPDYKVSGNPGRGPDSVRSWINPATYDLSTNDVEGDSRDTLVIYVCLYHNKGWSAMEIDITAEAASASAVTAQEIVASLNANAQFFGWFVASAVRVEGDVKNAPFYEVWIRQRKSVSDFQFYIGNGRAEEAIGFNKRAGVAELPTYFARHTIENRFEYEDGVGMLQELDPANLVERAIIDGAVDYKGASLGYSYSAVQEDWKLLAGRSPMFLFTSGPSIAAVSTTETIIEYPAGAVVGALAKKTVIRRDASDIIVEKFEMPYTLETGDLITPP